MTKTFSQKELKFIEKSIALHCENIFNYSQLVFTHSKDTITLTCVKHQQVFTIRADNHLSRTCIGCPQCIQENKNRTYDTMRERTKVKHILEKEERKKVVKQNSNNRNYINLQKHIEKSIKIHGDVIDFSKVDKLNRYNRVILICKKCWKEWESCRNTLIKEKCGCPNCNKLRQELAGFSSFEEKSKYFNNKIKELYKDIYIIVEKEIKLQSDEVECICKFCGVHKFLTVNALVNYNLEKYSCWCQKLVNLSEYDLSNVDFNLSKFVLTSRNDDKSIAICNKCGKENLCSIKQLVNDYHCKYCDRFRLVTGEKYILEFLINNGIKYELQKTFDECKDKYKLRFDFYLPEYNTIIEHQGQQHYKFVYWFHRTLEKFEQQQKRDEIKRNFCKDNGIKLLEIVATDYKSKEELNTMLEKILSDLT